MLQPKEKCTAASKIFLSGPNDATPTVPLEVRKEQTSRCAKKRHKVAKGEKGWYSVPFTVHCMMETLKSVVD